MSSVYISNFSLILPEIESEADFLNRLNDKDFNISEDLSLKDFNARKHVSDRRMLKAISHRDSYSIASIEKLGAQIPDYQSLDPNKVGFFVGACPSSMQDYDNYLHAVKGCIDTSGQYIAKRFGGKCMTSRPTTLLLGLPNNVLCYGSMLLKAHGPNNNFVSEGVSSTQALCAAKRSIDNKHIQRAYVGGYSEQSDLVKSAVRQKLNHNAKRFYSDGAGFICMNSTGDSSDLEYLGTVFRSAKGIADTGFEHMVYNAILDSISSTGIDPSKVGAVFLPESSWLENGMKAKISSLLTNAKLTSLDKKFAYTAEVSGIIEIATLLAFKKEKLQSINFSNGENFIIDNEREYKQLITFSLDGDVSVSTFK